MSSADLRLLEIQLAVAEELFIRKDVFGTNIIAIRDTLRTLIDKVTAERIRAEEREKQFADSDSSDEVPPSPSNPHLVGLERSVLVYQKVIENFERARERMTANRRGASDGMMVSLDEVIASNEQSIASVRRILATALSELKRERTRLPPE